MNVFSSKLSSDNRKPVPSSDSGQAPSFAEGSAIQIPKWVGILAIIVAFTLCWARAEAQQPPKLLRIGYLSGVSASAEAARRDAFSQELRKLGYVEGKNIVVDYRYSDGKYERLAALAAELVRLKPDIIVTGGGPSTRALKQVTSTIPVVMTNDPDPVANGFVASLARPGGNITGFSTLAPEISGKRLELLREVVPALSRLAVLGTSSSPAYTPVIKEIGLPRGL